MEDLLLTAVVPDQMMVAQQELIGWCDRKISSVNKDVTDMAEAIEHARAMKWGLRTLKDQHSKAAKRLIFYTKMRDALKTGYYIVPNFPIQLFAVKTNRKNPLPNQSNYYWDTKREGAQELPIGEGVYKNPSPIVERTKYLSEGKESSTSEAVGWDELEFPVTMLRPEIIEVTNKAMALKIFDQFGVLPASKNQDPIIVGQIVTKKMTLSFMIAWHFDTKILK